MSDYDWSNQIDEEGETPVTRAVKAGNQPIIQLLITLADAPPAPVMEGETLMHAAAREQRVGDVKALIDLGQDVNAVDTNGLTPLHWAAINGCLDLAKLLLNRGADPNLTDDAMPDMTPLSLARLMRYQDIAAYLSQNGGY